MLKMYDVIIIGSGPAGLCAAIYAGRARLETLIIEKNYMSGGQVINTYEVDNYPGLPGISGFDLGIKFREQAENQGANFVQAEVVNISIEETHKVVHTGKEDYCTKTVLIASGASHRLLDIPGEKELIGMGVSYCATCDGAFFREKTVAVVGGGDVAVEDAIFLARGCKKVYVIHRRDELRAAKSLQEKLLSLDNVEVIWDNIATRIDGKEQVESIHIENVKDKVQRDLKVDGVFVAVGIIPNSDEYKNIVDVDKNNYIIAGEEGITSVPGIFAAGDIRTKMLRQIITAASDGANAITSIQNFLIEN